MIKHMSVRLALASTLLLGATTFFTGCESQKGPAQKAGENFDKTVEKATDAVNPPGPVEKVGRDVDKATGNK